MRDIRRLTAAAGLIVLFLSFCFGLVVESGEDTGEDFAFFDMELPRLTHNAADFDSLTARAFNRIVAALQKELNDLSFQPILKKYTEPFEKSKIKIYYGLEPAEIFWYSTNDTYTLGKLIIFYPNAYEISPAAIFKNKQMIREGDEEKLISFCELAIYCSLAHEMIHAARKHTRTETKDKWYEEFIASSVQPYLTSAVLTENEGADYKPADARAFVIRSQELLELVVSQELISYTTEYISSEGRNRPGVEDPEYYLKINSTSHTYINMKVAKTSMQNNTTLDALVKKYLISPASSKN